MTREEYQAAMKRTEVLMTDDPAPDTAEGMELERLVREITIYGEQRR